MRLNAGLNLNLLLVIRELDSILNDIEQDLLDLLNIGLQISLQAIIQTQFELDALLLCLSLQKELDLLDARVKSA